jgi:hypothetical protein
LAVTVLPDGDVASEDDDLATPALTWPPALRPYGRVDHRMT